MLERIHDSGLEQAGATQRGEKIFFHAAEIFVDDGIAGDQHEVHRPGKSMLVAAKGFAQQSPRAAALDGTTDFFTRDYAEPRRDTGWQRIQIGYEAAQHEAVATEPDAREIAALREPRRTAQTQAGRRRGIHKIKPASGVCGPRDGGWPGWPCPSWWNYGSEIHAGVSGGFSTVDTGVS